MIIQYKYKDRLFDDIRDVILNNSFVPDFDYILEEYIPFQAFITGRTFFRDVFVVPDVRYEPELQEPLHQPVDELIFSSFEGYLEAPENQVFSIAAVSGGVDSSTVAMKFRPSLIYTGYYDGEEYDETDHADLIGNTIGAEHLKIKLVEQDFLDIVYKISDVFCTPIGGLGPLMEYVLLRKVLKKVSADSVLFGHGGDEIFMGYYFNHFVRNFYHFADRSVEYIPTFVPSMKKAVKDATDLMIITSINRTGRETLCSKFVRTRLEPLLFGMNNVVDKLLYVNINFILPSLLHLNQQMCRSLGVKSYSPFTSEGLIKYARALNTPMTEIPKEKLRTLNWGVPKVITEDYRKKGFPIPMDTWYEVSKLVKEEYDRFRIKYIPPYMTFFLPEYNGLNRFTWGVAQAGMYLNRFFKL